jgi:hypothetical protein
MFQLNYEKPSSGRIRVPNESYHVHYIKPLFMLVYIQLRSLYFAYLHHDRICLLKLLQYLHTPNCLNVIVKQWWSQNILPSATLFELNFLQQNDHSSYLNSTIGNKCLNNSMFHHRKYFMTYVKKCAGNWCFSLHCILLPQQPLGWDYCI